MKEEERVYQKFSEHPFLKYLIRNALDGTLDKLTQEQIDKDLSNYLFFEYAGKHTKGKHQMFESIHKFLNRMLNYLQMTDAQLIAKFDEEGRYQKKIANLPSGCTIDDADDVVKFAKKLTQEHYNHSEAGELFNVGRTAVKNWVDKGLYGCVGELVKKRTLIARENLVEIYRQRNHK